MTRPDRAAVLAAVHSLTRPPDPAQPPDLDALRVLLDANPRMPLWLDAFPAHDDGCPNAVEYRGILAPSTPAEVDAGADVAHEVGDLYPLEMTALAAAAINAAPWLLDEYERLAGPRCPSRFVVPDGDGRVLRCTGTPGHPGWMHGCPGVAWADGAALDQHPAEAVMVRLSVYRRALDRMRADVVDAALRLRVLIDLHANRGDRCAECARTWPCESAKVLGLVGLPPAVLTAVLAPIRPGNPAPDWTTGYTLACPGSASYGHGLSERSVHSGGCCDRFATAPQDVRDATGLRIPNTTRETP